MLRYINAPDTLFLINFEYYNFNDMNKKISLQTGNLVLRNNNVSPAQNHIKAKGIIINEKFYIDIDSMLKTPISREEALNYKRKMKMFLPTCKQLDLIRQNVETINNSLHNMGYRDCLLFYDINKEFWTSRHCCRDNNERRRVLLVAPI